MEKLVQEFLPAYFKDCITHVMEDCNTYTNESALHGVTTVGDLRVALGRSVGYLRATCLLAQLTGATQQQHRYLIYNYVIFKFYPMYSQLPHAFSITPCVLN
jgi:hypothetical protein